MNKKILFRRKSKYETNKTPVMVLIVPLAYILLSQIRTSSLHDSQDSVL